MSEYAPSPCFYCAHYDADNHEGHTCRAYPDGIPMEFVNLTDRHLEVRGDEDEAVAFTRRDDLVDAEARLLDASLALGLRPPDPRNT